MKNIDVAMAAHNQCPPGDTRTTAMRRVLEHVGVDPDAEHGEETKPHPAPAQEESPPEAEGYDAGWVKEFWAALFDRNTSAEEDRADLCREAARRERGRLRPIIDELRAERDEMKYNYEGACKTVAKMHAAAVGGVTGPKRGVIADVADLYAERNQLRKKVEELSDQLSTILGIADGQTPSGHADSVAVMAVRKLHAKLGQLNTTIAELHTEIDALHARLNTKAEQPFAGLGRLIESVQDLREKHVSDAGMWNLSNAVIELAYAIEALERRLP